MNEFRLIYHGKLKSLIISIPQGVTSNKLLRWKDKNKNLIQEAKEIIEKADSFEEITEELHAINQRLIN